MFGKRLSEYVGFMRPMLFVIVAVAVLRLGLSFAGVPTATVKWLSPTIVTLAVAVYYPVKAHSTRFGGYRHLYPLGLLASLSLQAIVTLGIVIAIASGHDNIYTVPEMSAGQDGKNWFHAFAHLVIVGAVIGPLFLWLVSSIVFLVARLAAPRSA